MGFTSFGYISEVGLLNNMEVLVLIFLGTSMVAVPMYTPTNSAEGFPLLHILPSTCLFFFFNHRYSTKWEVISHCVCVCVSLLFNSNHRFIVKDNRNIGRGPTEPFQYPLNAHLSPLKSCPREPIINSTGLGVKKVWFGCHSTMYKQEFNESLLLPGSQFPQL